MDTVDNKANGWKQFLKRKLIPLRITLSHGRGDGQEPPLSYLIGIVAVNMCVASLPKAKKSKSVGGYPATIHKAPCV